MKTWIFFAIFPFLVACVETDESGMKETEYRPLLIKRAELENSIKTLAPQPLKNTGKIYIKGNYIYLAEKYKGIHVINNSNPSKPERIQFIQIPGCADIAIKGNIMYADNCVDLVAIDIADIKNIKLSSRKRDIFPEINPPDLEYIPSAFQKHNRPDSTYILEWVEKY